ncbi:MAG: TetR family transcriptional regulator [Mycobacterium sp.]
MPETEDTRSAVLEAAIRLIARGGLQAVSHRAVEAEAGVSHGTTTYHFGTRQNIVDAVLEHLAARDMALAAATSPSPAGTQGAPDPGHAADRLAAVLSGDRDYALARYELMLEAARRPELLPSLMRWRLSFTAGAEEMLRQAGAASPRLAAHWLIAALDGLILDGMCTGSTDFRQHAHTILPAMITTAMTIR